MTTNESQIAIKVHKLVKTFHLPRERHAGLKQLIINFFKGKHERGYVTQKVLKDVSFEINKGDFFGIVGRNGSGKSTLLKLLAGIYEPDSGEIAVNGSLVPFIELGVGFNPELTGRENVFMNGALLGFNTNEMTAMYDDIVEFAELDGFMDQKLKNYSSGMQVRLAFSIAIRADTDILVLDEVLAVGDEAFQRKCYEYFAKLKRDKKTVILVTHSMDSVLQFCNRAMLIDKGHKTVVGTPLEIAKIYRELNNDEDSTVNQEDQEEAVKKNHGTKYIDAMMRITKSDRKVVLDLKLNPKRVLEEPIVAIGVYADTGEEVYRWVSDEKKDINLDLTFPTSIQISLDNIFPVGTFTTIVYIKKRDRTIDYAVFNDIATFDIKNHTPYQYATRWRIPERAIINREDE